MIRGILIGCVIAAVSIISTDTTVAQRGPFRVNQAFRKLGGGWSSGYHWRTPGHRVEYYNPYSRHNSSLKIGGIPQGSGSYLARLRNDSDRSQTATSPFDQIGNYDETSSYNFMPTVDYSVAPGVTPPNVVTSEIVEEQTPPAVNYQQGPENNNGQRNSIMNQPKSKQPSINQQPSPSDQPVEDDGVSLWRTFDELEMISDSSLSSGGR